jgi:SSS family transporter
VYIFFGLLTNFIVTAMLLLGGSAVINYLTGMNTYACCMLLPVGVILYTAFGGIKATFLMDFTHTAIIFIIILIFVFTVYATNDKIGSIDNMYDLLYAESILNPVEGNEGGQLATMSSVGGIIFGVINIVGNFGTVFVDNAYWQRAIAAHPRYAVKAYLIGGLSWFAIPFTLATTMGLAGRALHLNLKSEDVGAGLVLPSAAFELMGKSGAALSLLIVFMAVTSALSAELIAVSSLVTYDIYKTYMNNAASNHDIKRVADIIIVCYGIFAGILAIILNEIGINLGYLYELVSAINISLLTV